MLKLIVGIKGTGKTKTLIEMVNKALGESRGSVVCIEKGSKLIYDIKYQARLIDTEKYGVTDAASLFGFVSGIYASNHDVTDLFIDSALKICNNDIESFKKFILDVAKFGEEHNVNFVITSSLADGELPEELKAYL